MPLGAPPWFSGFLLWLSAGHFSVAVNTCRSHPELAALSGRAGWRMMLFLFVCSVTGPWEYWRRKVLRKPWSTSSESICAASLCWVERSLTGWSWPRHSNSSGVSSLFCEMRGGKRGMGRPVEVRHVMVLAVPRGNNCLQGTGSHLPKVTEQGQAGARTGPQVSC